MERKEYLIQDEPEYLAKIIVEDLGDGIQVPFLHLDVRSWSPSSFKKLLRSWRIFRQTVSGNLFALSNRDDTELHRKFVKRLGFKFFRAIECPDGKVRPCYISQEKSHG